jgi:uncharacterized membrane protein (DUF4010 family)
VFPIAAESSITELAAAARLAIAALVGLGVGVEREWSVQKGERPPRFAGLRTFTMMGGLGGVAGLLLAGGHEAAAGATVVGAVALTVAAYVMTMRPKRASGASEPSDPDGTTEVAALVVVAVGTLAGLGLLALAAGAGAIVVVALNEKQTLHGVVKRIPPQELGAALRFAALALVVIPLLPEGPLFGPLAFRPRMLWEIVLIFCALDFAGFVARRAAGSWRGYEIVGLLGGLVSSTAITLDFSRRSRAEPRAALPLALGVVGACTTLVPRVLIVSTVLNPEVGAALLPLLLPAALIGSGIFLRAWRRDELPVASAPPLGNPLRLWPAIRLAVAFQLALFAIDFMRARWSLPGVYGTAGLLGLTDMDALTFAMSRPTAPLIPAVAARAIAVGMLINTAFKMTLCATIGGREFRGPALAGLAALGAGIGVAFLVVVRA